jgi:uncharacterized FlaG/YvyC family protein
MLYQQLIQSIPRRYTQSFSHQLTTLSTGVSIQFLGRKKEVVSLHDSAVGTGQPIERKTKNLGNIGLDIETDLREFEKENTSRRISESLEATSSEQQQGTSARNVKLIHEQLIKLIGSMEEEIQNLSTNIQFKPFSNQIIQEEAIIIDSKYDCQ